jgi:D-3-phosphoglycerate dehydrogenase
MSKYRILILNPQMRLLMPQYGYLFDPDKFEVDIHHVDQNVLEDELYDLIVGYDGAIAGGDEFTERVLAHADRLKVISKWGVGIDTIDQAAAERLGIQVYCSPGAFADPVADTAFGYIFMFARNLHTLNTEAKAGAWTKPHGLAFRTRTIGVIGVGHIGKELIRRAKAFKMRLLGNDIVKMPDEFLQETGVKMVNLDTLLAESDFVCICADLNNSSYHLMDEAVFNKMKPEAYFINVARGKIMDEAALIKTLQQGKIAGAALDVFENEPPTPDNPLRTMANVIMGTHNAYNEDDPVDWVTRNTIRNLYIGLGESPGKTLQA